MSTPSHLIGGFAVLSLTKKWWGYGLSQSQTNKLLVIGTLLSALIDLDVIWSSDLLQNHHQQFTHWPLTWTIVTIAVLFIGFLTHYKILTNLAIVIFMASFFHLTLDLFAVTSGIPILAPLSRQEFAFTDLQQPFANHLDRIRYVLSHPWILYREFIIIATGFIYLIHQNTRLLTQRVLTH